MRMKKILILLVSMIGYTIFVTAEDTSFINEQIKQINKVLADNSTGPNDPKVSFSADTTNKVLTLQFARNKSLAGMDKGIFENVAGMLPTTILQTAYITSKGIVNGAITGHKFIKEVQSNGYKVVVIISGTDTKYEFTYPSSILSLE